MGDTKAKASVFGCSYKKNQKLALILYHGNVAEFTE